MNIKKILKEKQNNLQQLVNSYQQIQQELNDLNNKILEANGAIKTLQELLVSNEEVNEEGRT